MPPKKKETSKKPESARTPPTLINGLTKEEISKEQLKEHIVRLREELEREREERNYLQLERDKIQSFREVTDRKLEEVHAQIKNLEKAIEDDEAHHQVEIKVFKQKMKHLLCEHQNTISELETDLVASTEVLQDKQHQLEAELSEEMMTILVDMQEFNFEHSFRELQLKHKEEIAAALDKQERLLAESVAKNKTVIQQLEQNLGNITTSVMYEHELQCKSFIADFEEDCKAALNDAEDYLIWVDQEHKKSLKDSKESLSEITMRLNKMKEAMPAVLKENKELARVVGKAKAEFSILEKKSKLFSQTKGPLRIPQKRLLKALKVDHNELEQKFSELQIEVDELRLSVPQKIQSMQEQAALSLRPLEDELQALTDHLEKIQAQLHSVLSAPNVDQTSVNEITYKVEKDLEAQNSAIKNLKYKRHLIHQTHGAMARRAEAKQRALLK